MNILELFFAWVLRFFRSPTTQISVDGVPSDSGTPSAGATGRALITRPEHVTAHFMDTGSTAWQNQFIGTPMQGRHGGADFSAPEGSAVYAPYPMRVIAIGYYADEGRKGYYVIGTLNDGVEYYSGHLASVNVNRLQTIAAGTQLGVTNEYAHTHIQMKRNGQVIDPEAYLASH